MVIDNQEMSQRICYICFKAQEFEDGAPKEVWFENNGKHHPWKHIPKDHIAHADCYIEKCIKVYLKDNRIEKERVG